MQAIITKFHGPTNTKGARITATVDAGSRKESVTIPYPHELSGVACHRKAADALCHKLGWRAAGLVGGEYGQGYAFVFTECA